jgi:dTDP-4-amino-4,6-dideoxygalactose transaminase
MGLCVLPMVDDIIAFRRKCSGWYDELLADCHLQRPIRRAGLEHNYGFYPVIFRSPAIMRRVRRALLDDGIDARRYFHPSLNLLSFLGPRSQRPCPISESISSRVLCLPLYVGLRAADVELICGVIKRVLAVREEARQ